MLSEKDKDYEDIGAHIGWLVDNKNSAYGDSFSNSGEVLKLLYPNGVKPGEYKTLLAVTRIIDTLFRIATDKDAFGEDPWRDIVGYGLLALAANKGLK
jgi:hypothetical protein